jgi:hypothetical protein
MYGDALKNLKQDLEDEERAQLLSTLNNVQILELYEVRQYIWPYQSISLNETRKIAHRFFVDGRVAPTCGWARSYDSTAWTLETSDVARETTSGRPKGPNCLAIFD